MRIIFPVRIPLLQTFMYSAVLMLVQLAEHTTPTFAALAFLFRIILVLAFNTAGGLSRPSGGYIFGFGFLVVELGEFMKAILGEPANSNLQAPNTTMTCYVVTAAAMLVAAFIKRMIVRSPEGFADWIGVADVDMGHSSLGCFLIFFGIGFLNSVLPSGNGSIVSILNQLNNFWPLGVMLGTIAAIQQSGGKRSFTLLTAVAVGYFTILGMLFFSKQGMLTGAICWFIGASYMRYRLRIYQVFVLAAVVFLSTSVFTPISQLGRSRFMGGDMGDRAALVLDMIIHLDQTRAEYKDQSEFYSHIEGATHWFDEPQGLLDRLTMVATDDSLISFTERNQRFLGYIPILSYFANWIPHFIYPNKPIPYGGNFYAHEMGGLSEDDVSTGISFSAAAEGYHLDGFRGLALLGVGLFTMLFVTTDLICGDVRRQPWGLLAILTFAHYAPELFFAGPVGFTWFGNIGLMLAIVFCGYIAPVLGVLIGGSRERQMMRAASAIGSTRSGAGAPGQLPA